MRVKRSTFLPVCFLLGLTAIMAVVSAPTRWRFTRDHGLAVPDEVDEIRICGDPWWFPLDRGRVACLVLGEEQAKEFLSQLRPKATSDPEISFGDPAGPTSGIFPDTRRYPIPSNPQYVSLQGTWGTNAVPLKAYGCDSDRGDHLRVEHWRLANAQHLIKVYTDWN